MMMHHDHEQTSHLERQTIEQTSPPMNLPYYIIEYNDITVMPAWYKIMYILLLGLRRENVVRGHKDV